jgi:Uma2 family endonuclease
MSAITTTPANTVHLLSYEEALELPEDKLSEIVNGEVRALPPPVNRHFLLIEQLATQLRDQLDRKTFLVVTSAFGQGVRRRPVLTYRVPDLGIYRREDLKADDRMVWEEPQLLVECLSPSNRKGNVSALMRDYAEAGAPEVWLIYPEDRKIVRWNFVERFHDEVTGGTLAPFRFPEAGAPLQALWDAWDGKL